MAFGEKTEEKKEEKKKVRKGKHKKKNKPTSEKWKKYKISGEKVERERTCPRCGLGIFLAKSGNRLYCGKCHYTEFTSEAK